MIKNKKGFTLIEITIVLAIVGILSAILIPGFSGMYKNAKLSASKQDAQNAFTNFYQSTLGYLSTKDDSRYLYQNVMLKVDRNGEEYFFYITDTTLKLEYAGNSPKDIKISNINAYVFEYNEHVNANTESSEEKVKEWRLNGETVSDLKKYGINLKITPNLGDKIIVDYGKETCIYNNNIIDSSEVVNNGAILNIDYSKVTKYTTFVLPQYITTRYTGEEGVKYVDFGAGGAGENYRYIKYLAQLKTSYQANTTVYIPQYLLNILKTNVIVVD